MNKNLIKLSNFNLSVENQVLFSNLNLSLYEGEIISFTGPSGIGKSTLLRNILGYHLPDLGMVKISSYDINNIPSDILRKEIGYCPQNIQLFSGSIYENISSGLENSNEEDVVEASKLSLSHEFITKLPGAYNYMLRENGSNLSGGQRQAISLARALIKKPKILILDEPTSSMDGETEEKVMNNIYSLDYRPTVLITSHKINILTRVDKIAVILNGQIATFEPTNEIIKTNTQQQ